MGEPSALDVAFWRAFGRVMGRTFEPGCHRQTEVPQWDSLRHVELVFELEETFHIDVPQEVIADLFSDTDTVLAFLHSRVPSPQ